MTEAAIDAAPTTIAQPTRLLRLRLISAMAAGLIAIVAIAVFIFSTVEAGSARRALEEASARLATAQSEYEEGTSRVRRDQPVLVRAASNLASVSDAITELSWAIGPVMANFASDDRPAYNDTVDIVNERIVALNTILGSLTLDETLALQRTEIGAELSALPIPPPAQVDSPASSGSSNRSSSSSSSGSNGASSRLATYIPPPPPPTYPSEYLQPRRHAQGPRRLLGPSLKRG